MEHLGDVFDRFARFYDADYRDYDDDVALIVELAESAGGPVLELGCGTGRLLAPLAAAGFSVTGIDISPGLLAIAREKLRRQGLEERVTLVEADLRTFAVGPPARQDAAGDAFGFAFCTSNTLMHLATPQDQLAVLDNAARHLRQEGLLMVDVFNPDIGRLMEVDGLMELADSWVDEATQARVLKWSVRMLDLAAQVQETQFIYEEVFPDGRMQRTVCPFTLRFLWRNEAELMLAQAGFAVRAVWGDFEGGEFDSQSERLVLLAEKG